MTLLLLRRTSFVWRGFFLTQRKVLFLQNVGQKNTELFKRPLPVLFVGYDNLVRFCAKISILCWWVWSAARRNHWSAKFLFFWVPLPREQNRPASNLDSAKRCLILWNSVICKVNGTSVYGNPNSFKPCNRLSCQVIRTSLPEKGISLFLVTR